MNMKNTVILLIFLLSILGLIIGVYYTEDINDNDSPDNDFDSVNVDSNSIIPITLTDNENNVLTNFFTWLILIEPHQLVESWEFLHI